MLIKFKIKGTKPYRYSNNGYDVIAAKDGEIHEVTSEALALRLIKNKLGIEAEAEVEETEEENLDDNDQSDDNSDSDDASGADDAEEEAAEEEVAEVVEPDDLTELHKIGPALQEELNAVGVTTFNEMAKKLEDPSFIEFLIGLKGITEKDIPRLEDQIAALLSESE